MFNHVFTSAGAAPTTGESLEMDVPYMVGVVAEYIRTLNHHRLLVTPVPVFAWFAAVHQPLV